MRDCCLSEPLNNLEGTLSYNVEPFSQVITGLFSTYDEDTQ